jgi:hypothetical protein
MKKDKKKDITETAKDTIFTSVLDVGSESLADVAKDSITSFLGEMIVDTGASLIPGLSGAVSSYKRVRFEKNTKHFAEELASRIDEIRLNLEKKTDDQKQQIDKLFEYIMDYVIDEQQEEKIKYIVNGFVRLTEHESITEDFVLTYYDVLKELRIVDISVLRLYYHSFHVLEQKETYRDIMENHGITYQQYNSVRHNLLRLGIFTTKTDNKITDDLDSLFKSVKDIQSYLDKLSKNKSLPRLKQPKMLSKDSFELANFGKDFVRFFLEIDQYQ